MNKRVKIVLLGLMIWVIKFIAGGIGFSIFDIEADGHGLPIGLLWINGIEAFFVAIGLALALFLVYRDKGQNYKRTAWEAGIAWYVILLLMDLIVLIALLGLELELWFPLILLQFKVLIIPIVVGHLLMGTSRVGQYFYLPKVYWDQQVLVTSRLNRLGHTARSNHLYPYVPQKNIGYLLERGHQLYLS